MQLGCLGTMLVFRTEANSIRFNDLGIVMEFEKEEVLNVQFEGYR